jgi:hypothetical protein
MPILQIDVSKLIDAMFAEHARQGQQAPASLRAQTEQIIDSMSEVTRFRLAKLIERILPVETLQAAERRFKERAISDEDCLMLAEHHEALAGAHALMAEHLTALMIHRRRVN